MPHNIFNLPFLISLSKKMRFDVVSFGSAVVDTFVNTDVSTKNNFLHYPIGAKMLITDLHFDVGGGATNTSVAY